jgi:amino acid transporter
LRAETAGLKRAVGGLADRGSPQRSRAPLVALAVILVLLGGFISAAEVGIAENLASHFGAVAVVVACLVIFAGLIWFSKRLEKD